MTGRPEDAAARRKKITDQAMTILRETRAKIDPVLLSLMKDKLSPPKPGATVKKDVFAKDQVEALSQKKPAIPPKATANAAASLYASASAKVEAKAATTPDPSTPEMIPVDRQKVAQIIMEYMKLKQENKTRH